jgi:succinate-semialdehyde dehydrogenase/glutarate-semialdehyde dehydrogenase
MAFEVINPATGKAVASYEEHSARALREIAQRCEAAFRGWRRSSFAERGSRLRAAATRLRAGAAQYAQLMATEMGKPVRDGRAEIEKCASVCEYYAEHGERLLAREVVASDAAHSFVSYAPLGVVLAIMPWNFPFWQVFRFAAPALMAGNGALLKHAPNVSGCALAIEALWREAGLPDDLFRTLLIPHSRVGPLLRNRAVCAATLTGSARAGRAVARAAALALKKTVLELGGSDAYLILEDADVPAAASACATSRLINAGQSCIAAKRFVVVESRRAEFEEQFTRLMAQAAPGDPLEEATRIGPLARRDLRDALHEQVQRSVARGARLLLGGSVPAGPGAFYPPTVLSGVGPGSPAYEEELFGPAAAIISAADEADAIRIANGSRFGLGAAVFTRDRARGERIAEHELEAGSCFVNTFVRSDPRLPFGGIKESGYGRELAGHGIREFVNVKTVYLA